MNCKTQDANWTARSKTELQINQRYKHGWHRKKETNGSFFYQANGASNWEEESKGEFSSSGAEQSISDCTAGPGTFPSLS